MESAVSRPPWHSHLTLDLLLHVLSVTIFSPFLAALIPLCLRAIATPYNSPSFILTTAFAICVSLYRVLDDVNKRFAYGAPREINWEDEVVVITGGVGGLGDCLAEIFALRGVDVGVLDIAIRDEDGEEKEGVSRYRCDIGNYEELERVWGHLVEELGTPTILINNAAVVNGKPFMEMKKEDVERTFATNTIAQYHLTRLFLEPLLKDERGGTLVTVSSVLAHLGASNLSAYTASKAALIAYHNSITAELADMAPQIKTILVAPGQLDTQLFKNVRLRGWLQNFFGPVVAAGEAAVRIVEMIDKGEGGLVCLPAYARYIAWLGVLPVGVQRMLRGWSGVDSAFVVEKGDVGEGGNSSEKQGRKGEG